MAKKRRSVMAPPADLPRVSWLLKPSMELEAASRWFSCGEMLLGPTGDPRGEATGRESKYLCPHHPREADPATGENGCWRKIYDELQTTLNEILAHTFRGESTVVVIDWLRSYSSPYKRPTLRVEVVGRDATSAIPKAHIVKIALAGRVSTKLDEEFATKVSVGLEWELAGYGHLGEDGSGRCGPVFSALTEGFRCENRGLLSLKYSDAEHTLRAGDSVVSLEQAILDACTGGQPSLDSVEAAIVQLFAALEDGLYRHAWPQQGIKPDYLRKRLAPGLKNWLNAPDEPEAKSTAEKPEAHAARDEVLWSLRDPRLQFVDPALYFGADTWRTIPEMLVGTSHGDLHGRNVLVGVVEGEARWPIVFDYEDVACCNLVGWDFVKLETELKKAALAQPSILPANGDAEFIQKLYEFELTLNERTEKCYNHNSWPAPLRDRNGPPHSDDWPKSFREGHEALKRLAHVILTIRRTAWKCLELQRGRSRRWLHEYYFLLAAYGVYASRFQVSREVRPLKSLLIGAGVAAYRHAYGEDLGEQRVSLRKVDALDRIARDDAGKPERNAQHPSEVPGPPGGPTSPSGDPPNDGEPAAPALTPWTRDEIDEHRGDLAYARQLARSRKLPRIEEAAEILHRINEQHPFVIEPAYERVFALLELAHLAGERGAAQGDEEGENGDRRRRMHWNEADRVLRRAVIRFRGQMHEELLSRGGRLKKDQADFWLTKGAQDRAGRLYEEAAHEYHRATLVTGGHYYPAINEATCLWLAGRRDKACERAKEVLLCVEVEEERLKAHPSEQGRMWVLATKGEALVIAAEEEDWCEKAYEAYKEALAIARREGELEQQSRTMIEQLRRIQKAVPDEERDTRGAELQDLIQRLNTNH